MGLFDSGAMNLQDLLTPQEDQVPSSNKPAPSVFQQLGILSPSEKKIQAANQLQQRMRAMQQMALYQRQMQQMDESNALRAGELATGFGFPTYITMRGMPSRGEDQSGGSAGLGILGKLFGKKAPPAAPQEKDTTDDPNHPDNVAIAVLQEEQAVGGKTGEALARAAARFDQKFKETKDPRFQTLAVNTHTMANAQLQKEKQADAAIRSSNASAASQEADVSGTKSPYKIGERVMFGREGKDIIYKTFRGRDAQGNDIWSDETRGASDSPVNTALDPRSSNQKGEDFQNFRDNVALPALSAVRRLTEAKKGIEGGAAQGWAAIGVNFANNVVGTLKQLSGANVPFSSGAEKALSANEKTFQTWADKTGVNSAVWADFVAELAKSYNGKQVSENDVKRAMVSAGASISNPQTVLKILEEVKKRTVQKVDDYYMGAPEDSRSGYKSYYDFMHKEIAQLDSGQPDAASDTARDLINKARAKKKGTN